MTKDEYIRLRLKLAADFAIKCPITTFWNQPGSKPYGKMDWALTQADDLLRAADVAEPE